MTWKERIGLWRSKVMYYWKPFNQRRLRNFYQQFIQAGDLCFDIGAHLGNRSQAWLSLNAKVIALEPQPLCIDFLKNKFKNQDHFILIEKAVGSEPGKLPMYISHNAPTVSSLANEEWRKSLNNHSNFKVEWNEKIEVDIITLDQLIKEHGLPQFCKIDVEDFEEEVLKGLTIPIQVISFEFFNWTPKRTEACLIQLDQLSTYEYNWSIGESQRFELAVWEDSKNLFDHISSYKKRKSFSGDIYARLKTK